MIENILNLNKTILIYAKDRNFKYLFCNEAVAELAGLDSPQQIIGKTDADLFWRKYAGLYVDIDKNVMNGKIFINQKVPFTQPKSKNSTLLTCETILKDKNNTIKGTVGHCVDITGYTLIKNGGSIDSEKNIFYLGEYFNNDYLTQSEFQIFKFLLQNKSVEEMATILFRSHKTIESHIRSIVNKLQCDHKSAVVPTAIQHGLIYVLDNIKEA